MNTTDKLFRVRVRWSQEGTFFVRATNEKAARTFIHGLAEEGALDITTAETRNDYLQAFKTYPADPDQNFPKRKPIPENATIYVAPPEEPTTREEAIARLRMTARTR